MMHSQRLANLTELAATVGARVNRTGNGAFILLYRGQRHELVSLHALEAALRRLCGGAR